jgi:hypothetical protein
MTFGGKGKGFLSSSVAAKEKRQDLEECPNSQQ